ncbi:MAG: SPOR domain-containing protein [Nitrospiraceae bacterium]|nr:MAG: SPOR domain-containing protein [Nitrospiraceae bacterium]
MLRKPVKERAGSRISDEDTLSNKNKETQIDDNKSIMQARSDNNTDTKNKLNGKLKTDELYTTSQLVYTIQIESQPNVEDAQEQFNYLLRSLNKKDLKLLRIEKVGKYYTVRLGKFENYDTANKCIQENKSQLLEAIILKAHIKNERIVRLHE